MINVISAGSKVFYLLNINWVILNIESFCPLRKIVFKHENILFPLEINLIFPRNRVVFSIHVGLYDAYICVLFILVCSVRTRLTI